MNSETKFRFIKVCYFESFTQMHSTDPGVSLSPEKCLFPHVPPFLLHVQCTFSSNMTLCPMPLAERKGMCLCAPSGAQDCYSELLCFTLLAWDEIRLRIKTLMWPLYRKASTGTHTAGETTASFTLRYWGQGVSQFIVILTVFLQ